MQTKSNHKFRSMAPIITGLILLILVIITAINYYYRPKTYAADLIVKDLATLQEIFKKIDDRCKIAGFDYQKNPINFLNVGTFKSSEVGPMNLTYPMQWQGPYVNENPRIQGKEYQVVKTKKGLFITPGDGVQLPNGRVVGKDVVLNEMADIAAMMHDEKALLYNGKALAVPLAIGYSEFQKAMLKGAADLDTDLASIVPQESIDVRLVKG